jgi:methyl-accepting chemotaxis protein
MYELASTAAMIASTAQDVSGVAAETLAVTQDGRRAVGDSVAALEEITARVSSIAASSENLEEQVGEIGRILGLIDDLSDQTNLLALNAAIEAARAGEHGRGFSVVATEIRHLADKAREATAQIQDIVAQVHTHTRATVASSSEGALAVRRGSDLVLAAAGSLDRIAEMVDRTTQSAQEISAATEEQRAASEQVVAAMSAVTESSARYATGSNQTAAAADEIAALAGRMLTTIETFSVDDRA